MSLIAMPLLGGRRDVAEIARFVTPLPHAHRQRLGLPRKKGSQAFMTRKRAPSVVNGASPPLGWHACRLDGKTIPADPFHCQIQSARLIIDMGGDYCFKMTAE